MCRRGTVQYLVVIQYFDLFFVHSAYDGMKTPETWLGLDVESHVPPHDRYITKQPRYFDSLFTRGPVAHGEFMFDYVFAFGISV